MLTAARRLALIWLIALAGCGSGTPSAHEEAQLYVYNWADYIGKTTIADFERSTGIRITYETYDSSNTLDAKLLSGGTDYDLVTNSAEFFGPQIKAGVYRRLDRSKLPNWKYLDPKVLAMFEANDPGNLYAAPYLRSYNGFAYDVEKVRAHAGCAGRQPRHAVQARDRQALRRLRSTVPGLAE